MANDSFALEQGLFFTNYGFEPKLLGHSTRTSKTISSLLDHIFSNIPVACSHIGLLEHDMSDHKVLIFLIGCAHLPNRLEKVQDSGNFNFVYHGLLLRYLENHPFSSSNVSDVCITMKLETIYMLG